MKYCISLFSAFFLIVSASYSQYVNYEIFPSSNVQIEPIITKHPSNPMILFASAYTTISGQSSEGVYVSTNAGANWQGTDQNPGTPVNMGDPGPIIDKNGIFILTHQGNNFSAGMFSNRSTDNGSTWSTSVLIAGNTQEKGSPGTDIEPSSPYYGRTYLAWTNANTPNNIIFSYTTNGGSNWSAVASLNNSLPNHQSWGAEVAFGPSGNVYVTWAATILNSPANEDNIGFAVSTNGGGNWSVNEQAFAVNGIKTGQFESYHIKVNGYPYIDVDHSGGSRDGWVYIVSAEINHAPAGSDPDVVFHRSTNGGVTWSSGIRVNQDAPNNGKVQFYPVIAVDDMGGVNVVYYDGRNNTDSTVEVFLSRSTDGGDHWTDYKISDHSFKPKQATGFIGTMGDHIGMTQVNNKLYPVWMDDHNNAEGNFRIWSATIDLTTIGINKITSEVPSGFSLEQNFPNPFNPSTKISFDVPAQGKGSKNVKLVIYDNTGREITTLINAQLQTGTYRADWDASGYASGVYYYKLTADNFSETRKMVLLK